MQNFLQTNLADWLALYGQNAAIGGLRAPSGNVRFKAQQLESIGQSRFRIVEERLIWDPRELHLQTVSAVRSSLYHTYRSYYSGYGYPMAASPNDFRLSVYANDYPLARLSLHRGAYDQPDFGRQCLAPFLAYLDSAWLARLQPDLQKLLLDGIVEEMARHAVILESTELEHLGRLSARFGLDWDILTGDPIQVALLWKVAGHQAVGLALQGDHAGAGAACDDMRGEDSLSPLAAFCLSVSALHLGRTEMLTQVRRRCPTWNRSLAIFDLALKISRGDRGASGELTRLSRSVLEPGLDTIAVGLACRACGLPPPNLDQAMALLKTTPYQGLFKQVQGLIQPTAPHHWAHNLPVREPWHYWLGVFERIAPEVKVSRSAPKKVVEKRILWLIVSVDEVQMVEQTRTKNGWSSGSKVATSRYAKKPPAHATVQDLRVLAALDKTTRGTQIGYSVGKAAFLELVGHPNLAYLDPEDSVQLTLQPFKLAVRRVKAQLVMGLEPSPQGRELSLRLITRGVLGLHILDEALFQLREFLEECDTFPARAEQSLALALQPWLAHIEVVSEGLPGLIPSRPSLNQLFLIVEPTREEGLTVQARLRVNESAQTSVCPGEGPSHLILRVDGQTVRVDRELSKEIALVRALQEKIPLLPLEGPEWTAVCYDPETALQWLEELRSCEAPLEWPQGEKFPWKRRLHTRNLRVGVGQAGEWFAVAGQLVVDNKVVMEMDELLRLVALHKKRYIPLDGKDFLLLSQELYSLLRDWQGVLEPHRKQLRLRGAAIPLFESSRPDLEGWVCDAAYGETLRRFREAEGAEVSPPRTLQAELRDYQVDGYRWLVRRSLAGVGACLADDMGLGKTLQALALLTDRAPQGASLVVAPASVTYNWWDQGQRFCPTLEMVLYEGKERGALLGARGPNQVLVCSYRILLQDFEALSQVEWNTLILDEAQFIKNPESKTAQATWDLPAQCRVATTGTPVENRLTEVWSLFRFLNPGLLGSLESFRKRFELGAERGDREARQRLHRLLSPFLLRRTKAQVLTELPPRTEINLQVELGTRERALYETLRRRAEESLSGGPEERFQLLAHLTRLRQACCHPALLLPEQDLESAKFEAFWELLEELQAGHHRALVFSQFVELLTLLRGELERRGVTYQYLDGSTPALERRSRVDAFQRGQGDLFLISLKAGGTGLNLTAADYVIHLDPWWNPAVEQQASDRVHRIGQTRPVTIYRLVARDTLEERVLRLQEHKRELAMALLDGQEQQTTLSLDQLRELLR